MSQQHSERHGGGRDDEAVGPQAGGGQVSKQADNAELDDLLDEIDGVLETNAEEFVRSFVQKGGQ